MERMPDYPSEYDQPDNCEVCGKVADDCDCPECPVCGAQGDPLCYKQHGLKPADDSVQAFCDHIGIEPIGAALRAIDEHNIEHVWLVLVDGTRVYYHSDELIKQLTPETQIQGVGVGGIAWDGSDWEWGQEGTLAELDDLREAFDDALNEYECSKVSEEVTIFLNEVLGRTTMDLVNENLSADEMDRLHTWMLQNTDDGDECPLCQCGTVEHVDGYVTCRGECGASVPKN